jgi:TctA family transporter
MIGIWVKLLNIPYKVLYPSALFFICIGVYGIKSDLFLVAETLAIGLFGYVLVRLNFHPAPILLGFVLGPRFEEEFRRALLKSRGDLTVFIDRPVSAFFLGLCVLLIVLQIVARVRRSRAGRLPDAAQQPSFAGFVRPQVAAEDPSS